MLQSRLVVFALRVMLVVAALWLIVLLTFALPGELSDGTPEAGVRLPTQVVLSLVLLSVLVVIVCIWRLLTLIGRDRLFSDASRRWVDAIVWSLAIGWALLAGFALAVTAVIFFTPEIRDPGIPMLLFGVVVLSSLPLLLMIVMRGLLRQATGYRAELEEVI
ncbi:nitrogen fixation/metabolism regulation signal transduction histidine kinase [Agrococcus sp. UYP33]